MGITEIKNTAWYKKNADRISYEHSGLRHNGYGGVSDFKRMKVNYDLFNNVLNLKDFEYVCKPIGGEDVGELPANMQNHDISSGKIKALLGMEFKRPFSWKVIAVNSEATTRKEEKEFSLIKDYVVSEILTPIKQEIVKKYEQELKGQELNEEQKAEINAKIEEEFKAKSPEEVKKYMLREHQDPVEVMANQLLDYLMLQQDLKRKFSECFKHLSLSAKEVMYVGILNDSLQTWVVNSLDINYKMSAMSPFIQDAETISVKYLMTLSEIVRFFGKDIKESDVKKLKKKLHYDEEDLFYQADLEKDERDTVNKHYVTHTLWKDFRKIAFLTYLDLETGEEHQTIVEENYKLNEAAGDIKIDYELLPEVYETWKIGGDIYINMRPLPGQFKDLDNLHNCKFPYYGVVVDDMNSIPTSPMDRLKLSQYYFNIVMYRLELLLASDKGKKVMMNINAIPDSQGIDIKKWQYFFESSPFMWYNPDEEGKGYADVNTTAKVIDLSLASDIGKYINLAEYLKKQAGAAIGITEAVEGMASPNVSVGNNNQNLIQTSNILEPYFDLHHTFKKQVLEAVLETGKIVYSGEDSIKLSYVLDDLSSKILTLDINLLENSTLGLFVTNSSKADEALQTIKQLSHAAMQNQKAELSDVLSILRQEGVVEAEETLKIAEQNRKEEEAQIREQNAKQQQDLEKMKQAGLEREHEFEKEIVVLKEEEKRKTVSLQSALVGMSFNPDADSDGDGVNDFLEIARDGVNADIKREELQLKREELEHKKEIDKAEIEIKKKKS